MTPLTLAQLSSVFSMTKVESRQCKRCLMASFHTEGSLLQVQFIKKPFLCCGYTVALNTVSRMLLKTKSCVD